MSSDQHVFPNNGEDRQAVADHVTEAIRKHRLEGPKRRLLEGAFELCWPPGRKRATKVLTTHAELAQIAGRSVNTIAPLLKELEEDGLIELVRKPHGWRIELGYQVLFPDVSLSEDPPHRDPVSRRDDRSHPETSISAADDPSHRDQARREGLSLRSGAEGKDLVEQLAAALLPVLAERLEISNSPIGDLQRRVGDLQLRRPLPGGEGEEEGFERFVSPPSSSSAPSQRLRGLEISSPPPGDLQPVKLDPDHRRRLLGLVGRIEIHRLAIAPEDRRRPWSTWRYCGELFERWRRARLVRDSEQVELFTWLLSVGIDAWRKWRKCQTDVGYVRYFVACGDWRFEPTDLDRVLRSEYSPARHARDCAIFCKLDREHGTVLDAMAEPDFNALRLRLPESIQRQTPHECDRQGIYRPQLLEALAALDPSLENVHA